MRAFYGEKINFFLGLDITIYFDKAFYLKFECSKIT